MNNPILELEKIVESMFNGGRKNKHSYKNASNISIMCTNFCNKKYNHHL